MKYESINTELYHKGERVPDHMIGHIFPQSELEKLRNLGLIKIIEDGKTESKKASISGEKSNPESSSKAKK